MMARDGDVTSLASPGSGGGLDNNLHPVVRFQWVLRAPPARLRTVRGLRPVWLSRSTSKQFRRVIACLPAAAVASYHVAWNKRAGCPCPMAWLIAGSSVGLCAGRRRGTICCIRHAACSVQNPPGPLR